MLHGFRAKNDRQASWAGLRNLPPEVLFAEFVQLLEAVENFRSTPTLFGVHNAETIVIKGIAKATQIKYRLLEVVSALPGDLSAENVECDPYRRP